MKPSIKDDLLRMAFENEGVKGRFKLAAAVVFNSRKVSFGINSYKTHTIMANGHYRDGQIHLHAETEALVRASKVLRPEDFKKAELWVVRVSQQKNFKGVPKGPNWLLKEGYREALAKPCDGCMRLITEFGIRKMEWTID